MQLSDLTVEVRDVTLTRRGQIRPEDLNLTATLLYNNTGEWSVTLPISHPMASVLMTPGSGIIVSTPTDILFSGPSTNPTYQVSTDQPYGMITVTGATDDIVLNDRLVFGDPSSTQDRTSNVVDKQTGIAEDVIYHFVNVNAGPGAVAARRVAGLSMGANGHRGHNIALAGKFQQLGDFISPHASNSGLGFRVVQRGDGNLVFETYAVQDKTKLIRLDTANNTLGGVSVSLAPPTATEAVIYAASPSTTRYWTSYEHPIAGSSTVESIWGRTVERLSTVSIDSTDAKDATKTETAFETAAGAVVVSHATLGTVAAVVTPMSDDTMSFGRDWGIGDEVTVICWLGEYQAVVTGATLQANSDGFSFAVAIGDLSLIHQVSSDPRVTQLMRRIQKLETYAATS